MEIKQLKVATTSAQFQPKVDKDQVNEVLKDCTYLTNTFANIESVNNSLAVINATLATKQNTLTPKANGGINISATNEIDALGAIGQAVQYTDSEIASEASRRASGDTTLDAKIIEEKQRAMGVESTLSSQFTFLRTNKQDTINDLDTIRLNASNGATALAALSNYATKQELEDSVNTTVAVCEAYTDNLRDNQKYTMTIDPSTGILTIKENY